MGMLPPSLRGRAVKAAELESAIGSAIGLFRSQLHADPAGLHGWYRQLSRTDRIGIVATSQAVLAFADGTQSPPQPDSLADSLLAQQRPSGAWPFITGLPTEDVVDATAWSLMGLVALRGEVGSATVRGRVDTALGLGTAWLTANAHPQGGWGITKDSPRRVYSTGLAIRALSAAGGTTSAAFSAGARWILSEVDQQTGAWRDASGSLSIPITAHAVIALVAAASPPLTYEHELRRATHWLQSIAADSTGWSAGPYAGYAEEVDVLVGARPIRIEYRHSPRSLAIQAMCLADAPLGSVFLPFAALLDDALQGRWSAISGQELTSMTSWAVHDWVACATAFQSRLRAGTTVVWGNGRRVVESKGTKRFVHFFQRRWPVLAWLAGGAVGTYLAQLAGVIPQGDYWSAILYVVMTLVLAVVGNFLFEAVRKS